jgi:2-polyprenyl-3-methyl-5-hydroxy-6-metoxy-1,4-benzoquinol methylase
MEKQMRRINQIILAVKQLLSRDAEGHEDNDRLSFAGYQENRSVIPFVEDLSDEDLSTLNELLRWRCFTVDQRGRRFGNRAWKGKRDTPQPIPDRRIALMDEYFNLEDKHVLEVGCFEGVHTVALAQRAKRVTAIDARIENVVKTIVRAAFYDVRPTVFTYNIDQSLSDVSKLAADVLHHVGVLYHLHDPVRHLLQIGSYIRQGMMLDTHYALPERASQSYEVDGRSFPYQSYKEGGYSDGFSGLYNHAKWLPLETIQELLKGTGFSKIKIVETRAERNGPRVLLFASR